MLEFLVNPKTVKAMAEEYRQVFGLSLCLVDADGRFAGEPGTVCRCCKYWLDSAEKTDFGDEDPEEENKQSYPGALKHVVAEAFRWGEPTLYDKPSGRMLWAVPIVLNAKLLGGLVACADENELVVEETGAFRIDLREAMLYLLRMAERENITNSALMAERRSFHLRQQRRAEMIHEIKLTADRGVIESYLGLEPELLSAISRGERGEAINILNRILTQIYHRGQGDLELIKSLLLELIVVMGRTALASGGSAHELLSANFTNLERLRDIDSEEALSGWVRQTLESVMDGMRQHSSSELGALEAALDFMREHLTENIGRDDAAEAASLSPSHFSKLLKERTGSSFTDLLSGMRIDRAAKLLRLTDKGILAVALESGFTDQSYFTKVFRRHLKVTPGEYRSRFQS